MRPTVTSPSNLGQCLARQKQCCIISEKEKNIMESISKYSINVIHIPKQAHATFATCTGVIT